MADPKPPLNTETPLIVVRTSFGAKGITSTLTTTGASALSATDPAGAIARAGDVARSGAHAARSVPQTARRASDVRDVRAGTRRRVEEAAWRFERFMKRSPQGRGVRRGGVAARNLKRPGKRRRSSLPDHARRVTVGQQPRHRYRNRITRNR